jgi:hypothetical protein
LLSQLLLQRGVACPQVLEISSVAHQLSCFRIRFSLCWFTGGFFASPPFSGAWSAIPQPASCCQCVVMVC